MKKTNKNLKLLSNKDAKNIKGGSWSGVCNTANNNTNTGGFLSNLLSYLSSFCPPPEPEGNGG